MQITTIKPFLEYYEKLRERTNRLIAIIPPGKLDWAYMPGKFTISDEVRHIAAIERWMFAETITGRKSAYHGCGKNLADGYENIVAYFNEMHRQSIEIFAALTNERLQQKCLTPNGTQITIWKWLRALTEHEIHHRGQLYIYLNMVGVTTPPMYGLTAEQVQQYSSK